ncbi:MAG: LD-carboxypeptidase [Bacilli bacterium]|nr:LD-carboxypeptidase [Bacilli bacterium]
MKYPNFLKEEDLIGIPAPSAGAKNEKKKRKFNQAIQNLQNSGYSLVLSKNLYHCEKGRSASAKERAQEVNEMFASEKIAAMICAAGGDFLVESLPWVDFSLLLKNPKIVAGFSDGTALLYPITSKYDIATVYGKNFSALGVEKFRQSEQDFMDILEGKKRIFESYPFYFNGDEEETEKLDNHIYNQTVYWKTIDQKEVNMTGRIIGGCLDVLDELAGTSYDGIEEFNQRYQKDGIIWYFDNCEMSMEEVIRILWKMKELHYFDYAKGVIFGRFGIEKSTYEYTVETCLKDSVLSSLNIPIIYDADITHKDPCLPIMNGSIAKISCKEGKGKIEFHFE